MVGTRIPSAQVVRYGDAKALHLLSALKSDGRWRIVVFDGDIQEKEVKDRLKTIGDALNVLLREVTSSGQDLDSFIEPMLVLQTTRTSMKMSQLPAIFTPIRGKHRLRSECHYHGHSCGDIGECGS